ncbi:MAG: hypothetical protein CMA72_00005, partial [Euryarchaeota archaeon]|nr:hypothetical protein [Euryarchaeota archaeon]
MNEKNSIILVLLFVLFWMASSTFGKKPSTVIPVPSPLKKFMPRLHQEKLKEAKNKRVDLVMIGDSITHSWSKYPGAFVGSNLLNLGFPGDRTQNVLWRIRNGALDGISPKLVTLMIGTNNLHEDKKAYPPDKPEDIFAGIIAIVSEVRKRLPKSKIVIFSIFPRKAGPAYERVKAINALLPQLTDGKAVSHFDLNHFFTIEKGRQDKTFYNRDLLHFNEQGYFVWAKALKPLLEKHGLRV